jgi:tRNA threonylcarbamoyladenosine biosynthesis protein TsaB
MIVLALETSSAVCAVALVDEDGVRAERHVVETHIHSEKLLPLVEEVCAEAGIACSRVDAIAVSSGPGSFTGLRIGVSAAKGLCAALRCPLVGVPTMEALATNAGSRTAAGRLGVCLDARQGDVYAGLFDRSADRWLETRPATALPLAEFPWNEADLIVTDLPDAVGRIVPTAKILAAVDCMSAGTVGRIALRMLTEGTSDPVETFEPLYLKEFVVRTKAR